ncbi:transcriptional repressor NrdR [Candidatus Woesearchaeota archaeon]|nr:transcriptional repressor NrdR [Candidatus Woesearchaeota archaeon]
MKCPYCGSADTKVLDKRDSDDMQATRRRRECLKCNKRFTTYERVEIDLRVIKKDSRMEQFDREKLKRGIMEACEKRPVSMAKIEKLLDDIENELRSHETHEIPSEMIGELVMDKLKGMDKVAYVRFASVYRQFKDVSEFAKEIKGLGSKKK